MTGQHLPALVAATLCASGLAILARDDDKKPAVKTNPTVVWIYRTAAAEGKPDTRAESERLFAPHGFMPGERAAQIRVNDTKPIDPKDASKGTCIDYRFELKKPTDWVGVYTLIDGNAWGTKPGLDVQKLLGVDPDTKLALRFEAKGEGAVTFKCGGVGDGKYPSSLRPVQEVDLSPTKLTADFREYTIGPILARDLTNLIDPYCVVTSGLDNPGRDEVQVSVRRIRIEAFVKARASLPANWRERLSQTCWVTYTPTGFDPTTRPIKRPTANDIRADLAAIGKLAEAAGVADRVGIILYGCSEGIEQVPRLARQAKPNLSLLLGIFNPNDAKEVSNAEALLRQDDLADTIAGCIVGNETLTFRRGTLADIRRVMDRLREVRPVPFSSTEISQAFGKKDLLSYDFTTVNAHALFAGVHSPDRAARWAIGQVEDICAVAPAGQPILVKEVGWPAAPAPFDAAQQAAYWKAVLSDPISRRVNVCFFDGLHNVGWKNEPVTLPGGEKVNVGPHWPVLFEPDRKAKATAVELLGRWKMSRKE